MSINRNKLYSLLMIGCLIGYVWVYYGLTTDFAENKSTGVCLIKYATNIPCPSCGSTRSIISLTKGDFREALHLNPLGYLIAIIMLVVPVWIVTDTISKRDSLFVTFQKVETHLKNPRIAIPLILLVIINWIWNIVKGL